ncbi:sulfite exporter TauE/SafE family protein [Methylocaldum sp. MU1018]
MQLSPLEFTLMLSGIAVAAGFCGSLFGIGGGIVIVPVLTLLFGIDIRYAIGASIVSVIATSSGAGAAYVRERMANLRVAMFLELGTTSGAMTGAYLSGILHSRWLFVIFGAMLGLSALAMLTRLKPGAGPVPPDAWADGLRLHGRYFDAALDREVDYRVTRTRTGLFLMYLAGVISGLLGIGSGPFKVPAMDLAMGIPIKASSATSNFMIGVTAAASSGVYFGRGDIDPFIAAPVAIGVVIGATLGSRILGRTDHRVLRVLLVVLLLAIAGQMIYRGLR